MTARNTRILLGALLIGALLAFAFSSHPAETSARAVDQVATVTDTVSMGSIDLRADVASMLGILGVTIEEDSPLWDCSTMGNRICGAPNCEDQTFIYADGILTKAPRVDVNLPLC